MKPGIRGMSMATGLLAAAFALLEVQSDVCRAERSGGYTGDAVSVLGRLNAGVSRTVLENGITVLVKEDHSAPVVSLQIWVGTGSIHEHEYLGAGLSHAVEHMIFKGTDKRGPTDITREINNAGGEVNAYTSLDRTVYFTDLPSKNWLVGLDVLSDALMHATFPEEEWKKEKDVILREFAMGKDSPEHVIDKLLWATAFTVHPYRVPIIGYEDIFSRITRNDLLTFFKRNYVPDNMIVVVAGNVSASEAETRIREAFSKLQRRSRPPQPLPMEPAQLSSRFARETGAYKVSRMEWTYHTVPLSDPDAPALDLLAVMAGQGRSSRLQTEIKEKRKLVHSINCSSDTLKEAGVMNISAVFSPAKEPEVIAAIQDEVASWLDSRFPRGEIEKAKRILVSSELSGLQTMAGQAGNIASGEFYAGDPRFSETYLKRLGGVTPDTLKAVARKYLVPENRTIVVLSPSAAPGGKDTKKTETVEIKPQKIMLECGVPILVREDHRLPFVYFCAAVRGGLLFETAKNNGITPLTAELLTRGTARRSSEEIATEIESLGGMLHGFSDQNAFGLKGKCLAQDVNIFMAIMADCLLNPSFPENEVSKQKTVQLAEIDQQSERPFFVAQEELRHLLFPDHPYRWTVLGKKESVGGIKRQDVEAYFRRHVVSGNIVLSMFGDISPSAAQALADKYLKNMPEAAAPAISPATASPKLPARSKRREPREQAIILAGFPGVGLRDPRVDPLLVLQTAVSGLSSKLGIAVREERGLAYYVGALQFIGVDPGLFMFYAGTREDAVAEVEKLVNAEVTRLTAEGLTDEEMERARNQLIADYDMSLQDNLGLATICALNELNGRGYLHTFTARKRFEALTKDMVKNAAISIMSTNREAVSVVLPSADTKTGSDARR